MLKSIHIANFKCFEDEKLELSNLNLFSGINSMGKSTVIQSLLLLRQAYEQNALDKGLYMNGKYTSIGNGTDLLYKDASEEVIEIELEAENESREWRYQYNSKADYLELIDVHYEKSAEVNSIYNIFGEGFSYIAADRLGPQSSYQKSYYEVWEQDNIGNHGEFATHYLSMHGTDKVKNKRIILNEPKQDMIINQVEHWMGKITPGIAFRIEDYGHSNRIGLTVHQESASGAEYFSVQNVGFGISYVLPVVLSLVKAKQGDLLVLENPEAHLHPAGQRQMGELMARAASGGVQIIVETHSDHVLNGIRLAVKEKNILPEEIKLNFFTRKSEEIDGEIRMMPYIDRPNILESGRLSYWPDGFFDEWDKAIDELF